MITRPAPHEGGRYGTYTAVTLVGCQDNLMESIPLQTGLKLKWFPSSELVNKQGERVQFNMLFNP